jgi:membrane dipeptidase
MSERDGLLSRNYARDDPSPNEADEQRGARVRTGIGAVLVLLLVAGVPLMLFFGDRYGTGLPKNPTKAARRILESSPVIDGHIDLPELMRVYYANNISAVDLEKEVPGQVDIPRLRRGKVGGFFWSAYTQCPPKKYKSKDFDSPYWGVRDTLEQIDVAKLLISKYSKTFEPAQSVADIRFATSEGKIASLIGIEGAHQLGNSLAVLRQYYALGVRYVTLTHSCNNAFADSAGILSPVAPLHDGLSPLGYKLVEEMNRLGMIIDLSHVSDDTAHQALTHSRAPVMWSHSSVRGLVPIARNIPDDLLRRLGKGDDKKDGVVMINFAPYFVTKDGNATIYDVADHIDYVAKIAGKKYVGIGSDFDGIGQVPVGLEDVSKYPDLFAELYKRGWNEFELSGLAGANFIRVFEGVERVARELRVETAAMDLYSKRKDLPVHRDEDL